TPLSQRLLCDRGVSTDLTRSHSTDDAIQIFRSQTIPRTYTSHTIFGNHISSFHILYKVQGSSELSITQLTGLPTIIDLPQRLPGCFTVSTKSSKICGLQ